MSYLFSASDDGMSNHLGIATSLEGLPQLFSKLKVKSLDLIGREFKIQITR